MSLSSKKSGSLSPSSTTQADSCLFLISDLIYGASFREGENLLTYFSATVRSLYCRAFKCKFRSAANRSQPAARDNYPRKNIGPL